MRTIYVQPEELEASAGKMESHNDEYLSNMMQLFSTVETLGATWQGKDNLAYTNAISKLETDFRQLSHLCMQYADFLKSSASAYRQTQDELFEQASRIG